MRNCEDCARVKNILLRHRQILVNISETVIWNTVHVDLIRLYVEGDKKE